MTRLISLAVRLFLLIISLSVTIASADDIDSIKHSYPPASDPGKVGTYPIFVKSGAGYFYDEVLEYRVWLCPRRGAEKKSGYDDYFVAFPDYQSAIAFSQKNKGSEDPLVLVRQRKYVNEPSPGVFEVIEEDRMTEWKVQWLADAKRVPGEVEKFISAHRK